MRDDTTFAIATAPNRDSKRWKLGETSWGEMKAWLASPADVKECGNYLLGVLSGPTRSNRTVVTRSAVTLDADHPDKDLPDQVEMLLPCAALVHTTFNSSPDELRYRIIIPTDREMTPDEYFAVCQVLLERLGRRQFDPSTVEPARYMFKPSAQERAWYGSWIIDGPPLDVDDLLSNFDPDLSKLPAPKPHANKRDPFQLEGVVGAFNRVYDFDEVIKEYELPYEKDGANRWHLAGARSQAGLGVVSEGLVYSHHVKDPAWGQTCSAFDLVRLHRFSELDEDVPERTPVNRRPSHQAMLDLAAVDARVVAELVGVDFSDQMDAVDWKLRLKLGARTGKVLDEIKNWDLIRQHDPAFQPLLYNEMTLSVEIDGDLPWRKLDHGGPVFAAADRANLAHYLEREYRIRPARSLVDELVAVKAQERFVHPVREYLESLVWDGEQRVETCLPGVRPTDFTRLVARKSMVAAVARVLEPGIKWDHTLVLFGDEGLGKSWWIERMARDWSATLGRVGDKDTLLTMQRSWIMIADEGYSLRKADADVMKEFLTRTTDVFRVPYERDAQPHKRHSVIWSTTNDEVFLRRQEGNRRFLIVQCQDPVDFDSLTDEYVDQVWAEAVHLYRAGERLFLGKVEGERAKAARERFTEEDAVAGVVQSFLDTKVPDDWDDMSPEARHLWLQNRADGLVPEGTNPITRTCTIQIWVECLGRRIGDHRRADLLEINSALRRVPGWTSVGNQRHRHYGPQNTYERIDTEDLI